MKKRKTVSINRIISDNDDAERQRRCRREGEKSGKVQKPLYLTVEQSEMLLELRKSIAGNQQDVIGKLMNMDLKIPSLYLAQYIGLALGLDEEKLGLHTNLTGWENLLDIQNKSGKRYE